ncbi:MAG: helix-turn-helix domain-containing protein [Phycisphaeraceae bacterium]|nr:helix-turn-helix domain-containing protein [Phycisphaerales bacterium]MCB9842352.1 helix-turn-helix domain-containing protein [Phycisphaeraceae bacterium]
MDDRVLPPGILPPAFQRDASGKLVEVSPATPCPELLTEQEAIRYLRLDAIDIDNPEETLRRYRKSGLIRGTQVGKCVRYRRKELEAFLDRVTERNPR